LDHIKLISNEFGIRGRIPRYRLGRYGPHSNDALPEVDSPSDVVANASIKAKNMNRISGNMMSYSQGVLHVQLCVFKSSFARRVRGHEIDKVLPMLVGGDMAERYFDVQ
jgi:hypothetical protein